MPDPIVGPDLSAGHPADKSGPTIGEEYPGYLVKQHHWVPTWVGIFVQMFQNMPSIVPAKPFVFLL